MTNLLLDACAFCHAPRDERCDPDCHNEVRPRHGRTADIAETLVRYPRPLRAYSHAFRALVAGRP